MTTGSASTEKFTPRDEIRTLYFTILTVYVLQTLT